MTGFMPEHGINPQFADMGFLIAQAGGNRMAERMERHILGDADPLLVLREGPRKVVTTLTRR
jgi:hypothetical protein